MFNSDKKLTKFTSILLDLEEALDRFTEVMAMAKTDIVRDSALEEKKAVKCYSPKDCFKEAYQNKLIEYDNFWNDVIELRNETVITSN